MTPFETFWAKGYVKLDTPAAARKWVRHGDFRTDPAKNPLHTKSGKIEMFCQAISDLKLEDCPGQPTFAEPAEYLGNAKPGDVHVVSPHPWFRVHSQMANSPRLRELYYIQGREPVRINSEDAKKRGIADGDLVELHNDRGAVIAGAVVSDDIMPGVVSIYEGAWPRDIAPGSGLKLAGLCATALVTVAVWRFVVSDVTDKRARKFAALLCAMTGLMGWPVWSVGVLPSLNGSNLSGERTVRMALERIEATKKSKARGYYHWAWLKADSDNFGVRSGRYFISEGIYDLWGREAPAMVDVTVAQGALGAMVVTGFR